MSNQKCAEHLRVKIESILSNFCPFQTS